LRNFSAKEMHCACAWSNQTFLNLSHTFFTAFERSRRATFCVSVTLLCDVVWPCADGLIRGYYLLQGNGSNPQRKCDAKCIYKITNDDTKAWD
jgi:hypothetical protein